MMARVAVLPDTDSGDDLRRWMIAAAVVLAVHVGLVASYALMPAEQSQGAFSAPAIILDFAPMPEAPHSTSDVAPGPEMVDSPEIKEVVEKKQEEAEPQPKLEQPSDVTVPAEEPKPQEQQKLRPTPRTTASAPLRHDGAVASTPRAPSPGNNNARAIRQWRDVVVARLQSAKRYPTAARGAQGEAMIRFTLNRDGRVLSRSLVRSSGNSALDEEALAMVNRAAPFPAVPAEIPGASVVMPVPVRFAVR
jgi:periplasmic protein TonB